MGLWDAQVNCYGTDEMTDPSLLSAKFLRRTPGLQLLPQRTGFRLVSSWGPWEIMKLHWTVVMVNNDARLCPEWWEGCAYPQSHSCASWRHHCPQLLGVQPHWGSCPITSAGINLLCWLNHFLREDQLSWLSLLVAQGAVVWPAQGDLVGQREESRGWMWRMSHQCAAAWAETSSRSCLGTECRKRASDPTEHRTIHCSFPLGSEEEPRVYF